VGLQCNLLNAPPLNKLKKEHELTKHERRPGGGGANDGANDANDGADDAATPLVVHQRYQESVSAAADCR
jgi:hypothetical protein